MAKNIKKQKTYRANNIAKYFIYLASKDIIGEGGGEREGITNLKLQKILYLAQAYYLAKFKKPLFNDRIEAWQYGPVIPNVYQEYKKNSNDPIIIPKDETSLLEEDKDNLKKIWDLFGKYSTTKLVNITHSHNPWIEANKSKSKEITQKSIRDYYTPLFVVN
jgi:uncharacterized phage-associated protein